MPINIDHVSYQRTCTCVPFTHARGTQLQTHTHTHTLTHTKCDQVWENRSYHHNN